jgi:hypothetical protein
MFALFEAIVPRRCLGFVNSKWSTIRACKANASIYSLRNALLYVQNPTQVAILERYIESFNTGSLDACREAQKYWVKDTAPPIDHIIGFVETYRDPHGVRVE